MATISSTLLLLFLFSASLGYALAENCTLLNTYYYIVNKATGKVLADKDDNRQVNLHEYDPSYYASVFYTFRFYPSPRTGLYTIRIKSYMGALGVNHENNTLYMEEDNDSIFQQWFFNSDGTIFNGGMYNYGLKVNRTTFGEHDVVYLAHMDTVSEDDVFEFVVSPWQIGS